MKYRSIIILILFTLASGTLFAQRFNGGLMAGVAGTQVAGDKYSGFHKAGIYAGGFVNLQVSPRSIFQMELEFFQKGSRENPNPEKGKYDEYLFRTNYVEVPILYQFVINDHFQVEAGPSAGILITYAERFNGDDLTNSLSYNTPARFTLQINLGLNIALTQRLKVNLRTNNSLLNIRSRNVTGDIWRLWTYGQFNDCLVLSLVYQFKNQRED